MQHNVAADDWLNDFVGQIYDCTLDPSSWPSVLAQLHQHLDFHNAAIAVHALPTGASVITAMSGIPPEFAERMQQYGDQILDLWGGQERIGSYPLDVPLVNSRLTTMRDRRSNGYYRDWSRPQGIVDAVAIGFSRTPSLIGTLALGRHYRARRITEAQLTKLRILAPHLRRAASVTALLESRRVDLAFMTQTLDGLLAGVIIVDQQGSVLSANASGAAMIRDRNIVRMSNDVLTLRDFTANAALAQLRQGAQTTRDQYLLSPDSDHETTLQFLPLAASPVAKTAMPGAHVALFLSRARLSTARGRVPDGLAAHYGLTVAQSRVLSLAAAGLVTKAIAGATGTSPYTVKSHLAAVYSKTGANRRADLANLLARFRGPLV